MALAGNISQSPNIGPLPEAAVAWLPFALESADADKGSLLPGSLDWPEPFDSEDAADDWGELVPPPLFPPPPPPHPAMLNSTALQTAVVSPLHIFLSDNSYSTRSRGPHCEHEPPPYNRHGMQAVTPLRYCGAVKYLFRLMYGAD
jgi:hypothetical protein